MDLNGEEEEVLSVSRLLSLRLAPPGLIRNFPFFAKRVRLHGCFKPDLSVSHDRSFRPNYTSSGTHGVATAPYPDLDP